MKSKLLAGLGIIIGLSQYASAAVWKTERAWTLSDEANYSHWVEHELKADIFSSATSKYYGLKTDCADFIYTARAIYAFENGLSFVANDPTRRGNTITNDKSNWDHISNPTQRFFAFMNYLHNLVSTSTLHRDTFPIALNRRAVTPGSVFLFYRYHALLVHKVHSNGVPQFIESTVPREVRELIPRNGIPASQFEKMDNPGGLRKYKTLNQVTQAESSFEGYSIEQYNLRLVKDTASTWSRAVHTRLAGSGSAETLVDEMSRYFKLACDMTKERVGIVAEGVAYRQRIGRPMNYSEYDNYSTPSRDQKIRENIENFIRINQEALATGEDDMLAQDHMKISCVVTEVAGRTITLLDVYTAMLEGRLSSNPNDSLYARWGVR